MATDDNVKNLPSEDVDLDLDLVERPTEDIKKPFTVRVAGRKITLKDPEDAPWQDLVYMEGPYDMLQIAADPDDRKHLLDQDKLPSWKFAELMKRYDEHYGLMDKVQQARREQRRTQV